MSPEKIKQNSVERLAAICGVKRKPKRQPFKWVFDEKVKVVRIVDGKPVQFIETKPVERTITKTEILHDESGNPIMEEKEPEQYASERDPGSGKLRRRKTRDAVFGPKTIEVPVMEDVDDTWDADIAEAGIKRGPLDTAYRHIERMDYAVIFPADAHAYSFTAKDEPQLFRMIEDHLSGKMLRDQIEWGKQMRERRAAIRTAATSVNSSTDPE